MVESKQKEKKVNPVKEMFLLAALYLPMGFFLWFFAASLLMFPTARLADLLLTGIFGEVFEAVVQLGFQLEVQTSVVLEQQVEGRKAAVNLYINPMIYAWGMALLFGLIMATPLTIKRRLMQMGIGFIVVTLVTTWGVFWQVLTDLAFRSGPEAGAAAAALGLNMNMIALFYQLGYLMLPAVIPLATWILMNRAFIENDILQRPL
ncbi:MAG: exosortase H-associated membrane protein [Wenzhouxiangella sp.]|nr:exosortase H-associated membrane protein [Wenzhouxiangella sp.]